MKISCAFVVLSATLLGSIVIDAAAAPRNVMYLQQRPMAHQAMLVHYRHPKYAMRRSSQEVAAFASGDSVQGSTCVEDEQQAAAAAAPIVVEEPVAANEVDAPPAVSEEEFPVVPVETETAVAVPEDPAEPESEEEDEEEEEVPAPFVPTGKKAGAGQWPHTFFPMNFGSTSGGSIAVANSFSTGKGGAASHAFAYGGGKKNREV